MGLKFIIGTGTQRHDDALLAKAVAWLDQDPRRDVFYLVPNHIKFETEVSVLTKLGQQPAFEDKHEVAATRLQVFSFSRLAWYFLQREPVRQFEKVSDVGEHMLVRKVLLEEMDNLKLFSRDIKKQGFIEQLVALFGELQEGNVTDADLATAVGMLGDSASDADARLKLTDLQQLYHSYLAKKSALNMGDVPLLTQLAEHLSGKDLSHVMFAISGFHSFNAVEQQLIQTLLQVAGNVTLALVLDKAHVHEPPQPQDLFYSTGRIYYDFYQFARANQLAVQRDTVLRQGATADFDTLDQYWQDSQRLSPVQTHQLRENRIVLWEAGDSYREVTAVAAEIRRLVTEGPYRYQDIQVLTREMPYYRRIIPEIFSNYEIPYYLDEEMAMKHHPLLECLLALFDMLQNRFKYRDIMRFLRTELFLPEAAQLTALSEWAEAQAAYRRKIDYTENVILAYGYEGHYWTREADWEYVDYAYEVDDAASQKDQLVQQLSNEVRRDVRQLIVPFFKEIRQATTGREAAAIFYRFLTHIGIDKQLMFIRNQEIERGDLVKARIHEQTWEAFVSVLDDYAALLGDEPFELDDFVQIIRSGLEGLTYSKVPTAIDQVQVLPLDMGSSIKRRVTFIIGGTDQVLPKKVENQSVLSDDERARLSEQLADGKYLRDNPLTELAKEPFQFYVALLSATEKLYLSYPLTRDNAKDLKPSPYFRRLQTQLGVPVSRYTQALDVTDRTLFEPFSTYRTLLPALVAVRRQATEEKQPLPALARMLEKLLDYRYPVETERLMDSLAHRNVPETLTAETVNTLYGKVIHASVSKIENFNHCEYRYFLTYGLNLKERDVFELSPAAAGDFYHEALDLLFKELLRRNILLSELTDEEAAELTEAVLLQVLGENKFAILNSSNRMNYIRYQLKQTIKRVGWALRRQSSRTKMTTLQTEVLFGQVMQETGIESLNFSLKGDKQLKVRGKIDRLDAVTVKDDLFFAVVDYKSSQHRFDFRDVYYGLAMQMVTYLDIALKNTVKLVGKKAEAGGAFYLHIKNPLLDTTKNGSLEEQQEELLRTFGYQGILLKDEALVDQLDVTVEPRMSSAVYPFSRTAKDELRSPQFVSREEMQQLIAHNRKNFQQAGEKIVDGSIKLNPAYKDKTRIACSYCPFRSVCQFDVMLPENSYHRIDKLSKDNVLDKLNSAALPEKEEEADDE
ncbi:PD-(D/E)XK nuclease family protein [Vagococcus acidifermentans]|uniref:UvrD-like helicase C-terminal domain-containing protein n=1 Tax=Vagococcus acidifermentans TaxID=564710 RepID=A0A430ATT6_9ENTE|nr:PD-(D/E)XK nuclease family protein [Vagococcus acidifermentans]RSU11465.1 hypothetical protein CBF27_08180 [Vagococcus acidifermentans]